MEIITYLLGAGASAGCLPTVKEMASSIANSIEQLELHFNKYGDKTEFNVKVVNDISKDLRWLIKACNNHSSVDTFAKKLYVAEEEKEYNRLKLSLSIYFTLAQKFSPIYNSGMHVDKRYDNFWASILNRDQNLPSNLRIVSWNYDTQLELSFGSFFKDNLEKAYSKLNMLSFHNNLSSFKPNQFGIFKLNGSAKATSCLGHKSHYLVTELTGGNFEIFLLDLINSYNSLNNTSLKTASEAYKSELSFAWEHDDSTDYYSILNKNLRDTTILVVIGYSFPFFNRKVDKRLINEYMPRLRKVYFQAPDAEALKERFLAITDTIPDKMLLLRYDKEQFTFPNELDI